MVYLSELQPVKKHAFESSYLQSFEEEPRAKTDLWNYFKEYCCSASIHGVTYLTNRKLMKFER